MKIRILTILLAACILLLPVTVYAYSTTDAKDPISLTEECSLSLDYALGEVAFADVAVKLYKVATVSQDYQYTITQDFAPVELRLNGIKSQSEWDTVRSTLESYIAANNIAATAEAVSDETGKVRFEKLETGLYYVPAVTATDNGFCYYFASAIVSLPNLDGEGNWNYSVAVNTKPDVRPPASGDLEYKILKLWQGDGEHERPQEVTVDIIKDNKVVKTVVLSAENNWNYIWYAADDGSIWTVAERDVAPGYTVTIKKSATTFSIINSYDKNPPGPPPTGDTSNIGLYILLIGVSGIGLVLAGLQLKDKK